MKTLEERAQLAGDEQFHASYIPKIEKVRGKQFDHEIGEIEVHYTNGFEEGYLAGARAEVEAYKQRVMERISHAEEPMPNENLRNWFKRILDEESK